MQVYPSKVSKVSHNVRKGPLNLACILSSEIRTPPFSKKPSKHQVFMEPLLSPKSSCSFLSISVGKILDCSCRFYGCYRPSPP